MAGHRGRYKFYRAACECGNYRFGSQGLLTDLKHRGVAFINVADPHGRPLPATMALIEATVVGFPSLEAMLAWSHVKYIREVPALVTKWKATIAAFADELRGDGPKAVQGQRTHGKKGVLRWILHVSSAYHPELERLDGRVYLSTSTTKTRCVRP